MRHRQAIAYTPAALELVDSEIRHARVVTRVASLASQLASGQILTVRLPDQPVSRCLLACSKRVARNSNQNHLQRATRGDFQLALDQRLHHRPTRWPAGEKGP